MPVRTRIRYWLDIPSTDKTRTKLTIFRDCPRCQHDKEVFSSESHGVKVWTALCCFYGWSDFSMKYPLVAHEYHSQAEICHLSSVICHLSSGATDTLPQADSASGNLSSVICHLSSVIWRDRYLISGVE